MISSSTSSLHGVFITIFGIGTFITGKHGIGKSELALELIDRGHPLIADDVAEFSKQDKTIIGSAPQHFKHFIEVYGLGVMNVRALFGASATCDSYLLQLIIRLIEHQQTPLESINRFEGLQSSKEILGLSFPEITIPISPNRNRVILVESVIKNFILKRNGYSASAEFENLQLQQIRQPL